MVGETLFEVIADALRARIENGDLRPGEQIPSIAELMQQHGASRNTVQTALRVLIGEGLVAPRSRVGLFVREYNRRGIGTALAARGREAGRVEVGPIVQPEVEQEFPPGPIWRRRVIGQALRDLYFPASLVEQVPELGAPHPLTTSDVDVLTRAAGKLTGQRARVVSRLPTGAETALLESPTGTPVLEQVTGLYAGQTVVAVRVEVYAGDRHFLEFDLPW